MAATSAPGASSLQIQSIGWGFALKLILFMLSYWLFSKKRDGRGRPCALRYASCSAGGVFLGTLFVSLMPMVRIAVQDALEFRNIHINFPIAESLILLGFYLTLLFEHALLSHREADEPLKVALADDEDLSEKGSSANLLQETGQALGSKHECHEPSARFLSMARSESGLRLMFLVVSVSIHSVLAGVTLGLQDNAVAFSRLVMAVYLHEALMTVAMAVSIAKSDVQSRRAMKLGALLAITTPIGQITGLVVGNEIGVAIRALVQALATGMFFEVVFVEVLPSELHEGKNGLPGIICMIVGFSVFCGLNFSTWHLQQPY